MANMASGGRSRSGGCLGTLVTGILFLALVGYLIANPSGAGDLLVQAIDLVKKLFSAIGTIIGKITSSV